MASSSTIMVTSAASSDTGGAVPDDLPCWTEEVEKMKSKHNCEETLVSMCRNYDIHEEDYKPLCAQDGWGALRVAAGGIQRPLRLREHARGRRTVPSP